MFDALPEAFGSYRVIEAIGTGRFGPAYRAREDATGLSVAIKVFDQGLTTDQATRLAITLKRLGQAALNHPAIVPILTSEAVGERVWLAEPWFDAAPLDAIMQRDGTLPLGDVLVRVTQVAAALDFGATVGIHHGALHPRDVLVSADQTMLAGVGMLQALNDAGLAVPMEGAYVSPQRAQGLPVSAPDDIFSLAAITYELVYGVAVPARSELRSVATRPAGIDHTRFTEIVERALSPEAGDRPRTALSFAASVQEAMAPIPIPILDSDSQIPIPIPIAIHDSDSHPEPSADLPLRPVEVQPTPRNQHVSEVPVQTRNWNENRKVELELESPNRNEESPNRNEESESESSLWFPVAATLAIGLLMGFAGGYVVGQRDATPAPRAAERAVARDQSAGTTGRDFTESVVPPAVSGGVERPAATDQRVPPQDSAGAAAPDASPSRSSVTEPGVLQIDSRPRGARVFLDGRLVGTTPVMVPDVRPGAHAVRIDLRGHRRWVTSVDIAPGERQRVAASLER